MLRTSASTYVVLKRELDIYKHINSVEAQHPGRNFIRKLLNYCYLQGPHGCHICLVHEPLEMTADFLPAIRQLLVALDFLHSEPNVGTDLQLKNLLLPGPETSHLFQFEECEVANPTPQKKLKDRTIYRSLGFLPPGGLPILADFGEARFGDEKQNGDIMPNVYRAPEVILRSSWDYKVDIWNIAMVAWDIVSCRTLINGKNLDGIFNDRVHMAELRHLSSAFWDESGKWKEVAPIPDITLESLASEVEGKIKRDFFRWLRMALQ
ncbi:kinase-like protein [Aspergillus japonicus CBS 114.51]|uniref:Kinase-like protein n=1 Tax=Aspergillus japonicus CBS 114.51 TaxID=1448312 RepID=A0A8T8XAC7_ASPJA|nr:kinase-like protein [Aspergillus japonicus CBS 114.51]RAH84462.1 kinase-like protein [Aspergillus japonicus CBS 114.51]